MEPKRYRTPHEIAVKGFEAPVDRLGRGGALQFVHEFEKCRGDYAKERQKILRGLTLWKLRAELLPKR